MDIHKIKYLLYIAKKRIEKGHKGIEKERKMGRKEGTRINLS